MKKRVSLVVLILLMMSLLVGCNVGSDELDPASPNPVTDFEYEVNKDGSVTITKYVGTDKSVVIPSKIDNKNVTYIGNDAFNRTEIEAVLIPDTVIGLYNGAFYGCKQLQTVILSDNLISIGKDAFCECSSLTEIELPDSLEKIEGYAFYCCTALKTITVPGNTDYISTFAFAKTGLETVIIEEGVKNIGENAFMATQAKEVVIPSSVEIIGDGAFASCQLETIILNEGLKHIGASSFDNNVNLASVIIPATVEYMEFQPFPRCIALKSIYFKGDAPDGFTKNTMEDLPSDCVIYYCEGAEGFDSPMWCGYQTETWK